MGASEQPHFQLTAKQREAIGVLSADAKNILLEGGSRSGKTFLIVRAIITRALAAKHSRHLITRFRFNHCKVSIVHDTFPKVMAMCFPGVPYRIDKTDWFAELPFGSQVWFGGLDDKERTEKVLGNEYATVFLNECSQISHQARNILMTRLAQRAEYTDSAGETHQLRLKAYYDCNPPSQGHWSYLLFHQRKDPETKQPLRDPENYKSISVNPGDNRENLPADYLQTLEALPARMRLRFLEGKYAALAENALWSLEMLDKWRAIDVELPDLQRVVVAVDPSGAGDKDNETNDAIGICVAGLGMDGNAYVLEDLTVKAGPKTWGNIATTAYDRHQADVIVAEKNFGGEMVKFVIQAAKRDAHIKVITASRGKAVRAEPISALTEKGKIRLAGYFTELEDELCAFTTSGYMGEDSPNRADAFVWAMSELFPGMVKKEPVEKKSTPTRPVHQAGGWMRA